MILFFRLFIFSLLLSSISFATVSSSWAQSSRVSTSNTKSVSRPVKDKWALVIGVSNFADKKINLRYPAKDARDFRDYLVKSGNFAPDHVLLLTDEKATRLRILSALGDKWLPRLAGPDDLVVIYVSSHGSPADMDIGGLNYIVAHDTSLDCLYATAIPLQDLMRIVKQRVNCDRVVLILDACHSGAATPESKGLYRAGNIDASVVADATGQLVIASSKPDQVSWEGRSYKNSVFTYHLIKSLKTRGSKTTLKEAFENMKEGIRDEVLQERGRLQTPVLKSKSGGDSIAIAAIPTSPRKGMPEIVPMEAGKPAVSSSGSTGSIKVPGKPPSAGKDSPFAIYDGDFVIPNRPPIPPVTVLNNGNIYKVFNGPTKPTTFSISYPGLLTYMYTYHWNNARGARPGTITLRDKRGKTYGPFKTTGKSGQSNVPNAYWECEPMVKLKPGTYTIMDSQPSTWAQNAGSRGAGFARVKVAPLVTTKNIESGRKLKRSPETTVYKNGNVYGVLNGPVKATRFKLSGPALVTKITNYHWNGGRGRVPGKIALVHRDGTKYGPWRANGRSGQAGAPEVYWDCMVDVVLKPGVYTVHDSDPSTWSHNPQNGGCGMTEITGVFQ